MDDKSNRLFREMEHAFNNLRFGCEVFLRSCTAHTHIASRIMNELCSVFVRDNPFQYMVLGNALDNGPAEIPETDTRSRWQSRDITTLDGAVAWVDKLRVENARLCGIIEEFFDHLEDHPRWVSQGYLARLDEYRVGGRFAGLRRDEIFVNWHAIRQRKRGQAVAAQQVQQQHPPSATNSTATAGLSMYTAVNNYVQHGHPHPTNPVSIADAWPLPIGWQRPTASGYNWSASAPARLAPGADQSSWGNLRPGHHPQSGPVPQHEEEDDEE